MCCWSGSWFYHLTSLVLSYQKKKGHHWLLNVLIWLLWLIWELYRRVTFICGQAGVYALGAVVAKHAGDDRLLHRYLTQFREIHARISRFWFQFSQYETLTAFVTFFYYNILKLQVPLPRDLPNELLYGRAGFLWACSFLNKHIGADTISKAHMVWNWSYFLSWDYWWWYL